MKTWDQLFRSNQERLWYKPPPMSAVQEAREDPELAGRAGYGLATSLRKPKPKDNKKNNHGGKHHGPKHHPKNFDHRNVDGGKNRHGKR